MSASRASASTNVTSPPRAQALRGTPRPRYQIGPHLDAARSGTGQKVDGDGDFAHSGAEVHEDVVGSNGHVEDRSHDGRDPAREVTDRLRARPRRVDAELVGARRGRVEAELSDAEKTLYGAVSLGGGVLREPKSELGSAQFSR